MIVHLFEDQKFVDVTIENFNSVSKGINKYIVFSDKKKLEYVSNVDNIEILPQSAYQVNLDLVYENCNFLIIHFLSPIKLYILKHKPKHVKVLWSVWGSDAYDYFKYQNNFELLTNNIRKRKLYYIFRKTILYDYYHLLRYRVRPLVQELDLLKRINFVSTVLPYEFSIISNEFNLVAEYVDYNYGVNKFVNKDNEKLGESVLIGNSATHSNNHLDIFDIIKDTKKRLIVPLGYGAYDYNYYKHMILTEGNRIFKNNFFPITSFLSRTEYNRVLLSCNTAIMFHIRQQALANIFHCLFLGIRVFLNSKSLTYSYLNEQGMIVFDLRNDYHLIGVELKKEEKKNNREIVLKLRGQSVIKKKIMGIIDLYNLNNI